MSERNSDERGGKESARLLDHVYDGIQELDHPLPNWWLGILYGTIAFSIVYVGYYMAGPGPSSRQELAQSLKEVEALRPKEDGPAGGDEQALLAAAQDPEKVKRGKEIFAGKCVACHGELGQGVIGPNLTDDYWIHGSGTMADVAKVVAEGVLDKGMPPWKDLLKPDEMRDVVAYVRSIKGSNPPGAKAPQGELHAMNAADKTGGPTAPKE